MSLLGALFAIREVVVSKLFDFVLDKLGSSEFLQFATDKQIQEELQKLKKELQEIRALLDDAEERQLKDQSVKLWLSDLLNLAYDVDDIVDELQTEICKRNLMLERRGSSSKNPRLIFDSFKATMSNRGMMSKIKDVTAKLKDLEPQKNQLQLRMIDSQKSNRIKERQQPTSLEIETHVYGRDKDKEAILELVFKSDDEGNFVIPIVGMGGIGKTTLAQLVYNDDTVKNHFDLKAWVCVSDDFDITRITKAIFQAVTSESCNENDLNSLQEKLKKKLSEKKFLIVLDDVWNENYHNWTILRSPFLARAPGSKIIVTTRSFAVSSTMGASYAHSLEVLSEDDCLSVFAQHALGARDFGGHPNLKEVAEKIARKCKGLPLAAKTLGALLRTNIDYNAWKIILESEIWKLSDQRYDIIPALQLSYHHLPPHLKRCFAYCSILPKDYEFEEKEIILLWRAEGFLQEARDKHSIEDLGHAYFRDLESRSLLQKSNKDGSRFVMHDLINDLAQSVAGEICFRIEGDQQQISKNARHLSYISWNDNIKKFKGVNEAQHLRTFLPLRFSYEGHYFLSNVVLTDLLPNLRCLRVLSLSGYQIEELPDIFGDLKHLRYLNFAHTRIKCLPESISKLYNLETLLLRDCRKLTKLPLEMENLINLCYLDISGAYELDRFLSNFGTLRDLQILSLSNFVLHVGKGCHVRELEGLSNLKGQLCISGVENVVETQDAWNAKLHDMSGLDKLELKWCKGIEDRRVDIEEKVLDSLQPSKKLKELALTYYYGVRLAEWVGHFSFNKLLSLCLEHCPNCISLPSIGQLPLLKKVRIKGLHSVTSVGVEFFGKNTPNAFPSLEILEFEDMLHWENWNIYEVDEEARKFSSLRELCFRKCPKLLGSIPEYLPSLKKLVTSERETLVISIQSFPMLSVLEIEGCEKDCERLEKLPTNLHYVTSLTVLRLHNCLSLVSISKNNLPLNLKTIEIRNCEKLLCLLEEGENVNISNACLLEQLDIFNCPSLVSLSSRGELPTGLKRLTLCQCAKLESIAQVQDNSSLEYIMISDCTSIKYLPQGLNKLSHLRSIHIQRCSKLVSFPESGLPTSSIEELTLLGCDELQALPDSIHNLNSLEVLRIIDCSSVISFPEEGIPTNLRKLAIGGPNICKLLIEWGLQRLTSLKLLSISNGFPDAKLFPQEDIRMVLPCSLTTLKINNFPNLEILSSKGFQGLTSVEELFIEGCPNLKSLPEKEMLSSLLLLSIYKCPVLEERCEKNKGPEWSKIAHVPFVEYNVILPV